MKVDVRARFEGFVRSRAKFDNDRKFAKRLAEQMWGHRNILYYKITIHNREAKKRQATARVWIRKIDPSGFVLFRGKLFIFSSHYLEHFLVFFVDVVVAYHIALTLEAFREELVAQRLPIDEIEQKVQYQLSQLLVDGDDIAEMLCAVANQRGIENNK